MDRFAMGVALGIRMEALIPDGASVVAAVSGGSDSCALAAALVEAAKYRVSVLHVHHGLRGAEADRDEVAAGEAAKKLGLPFASRRVTVRDGASLEAAAREAREGAYLAEAQKTGASFVATGHTRDDQAETVLYRAARGAGVRGLRGILPRRPLGEGVELVRPLLAFSRAEARAYATSRGLAFVEDSSNADTRFARNAIRRDVLPALEKARPGAARSLAALARDAAELEAWVAREARGALERLRVQGGLDLAGLGSLPPSLRQAVVELAGPGPLRSADRESLNRLWGPAPMRLAILARGWTADVRDGVVRLSPRPARPDDEQVLTVPGECILPRACLRFTAQLEHAAPGFVEKFAREKTAWEEALDADAAPPPYSIGLPKRGERFQLLGAPGSRKIADVLSDLGVPRVERRNARVVRDADGRPVWLVGVRLAESVRITAGTQRIVRLTATPIS